MDGQQFDQLVKGLASAASRRNVLKGILGGAAGLFVTRRSVGAAGEDCSASPTICTGGTTCCPGSLICGLCCDDADCGGFDTCEPATCGTVTGLCNISPCLPDEICCNATCVSGCCTDSDCASTPDTPICNPTSNQCVQCTGNVDCGGCEVCSDSTLTCLKQCTGRFSQCCPTTAGGFSCEECCDSDDCPNEGCALGSCDNGTCVLEPNDENCASEPGTCCGFDGICAVSNCQIGDCEDDSDCEFGCVIGNCVNSSCQYEADNSLCEPGTCCGEDGLCKAEYCPPECLGDSDCPSDEVCCDLTCVFGNCCTVADCVFPSGAVCGEPACEDHVCVVVNCPDCESDSDCPQDECCGTDGTCAEEFCEATCKSDGDCGKDNCCCKGGTCSPDCCDAECKDDKHCAKGTCCCKNGTCSAECCDQTPVCKHDGDCGKGHCCCHDGKCSDTCCKTAEAPKTPQAPKPPVVTLPVTGSGDGDDATSRITGAALLGGAAALLGAKLNAASNPDEESTAK